jgi:hypothetical protein
MGFIKDFTVNIIRLTTAVAQKGFGKILILSHEENHTFESYSDIDGVAADFGVETKTYKLASALFGQKISEIAIVGKETLLPAELVALLNQTVNVNDSWFGLVCTDNADATITALATWIDTQQKVYAVTSQNKSISNASNNTLIAYHPTDYLAEKSLAYMLIRDIGGWDLDGKPVPSITESGITLTEYNVLKENNINVALKKFGVVVVDGGDMAGGEKLDVMLGEYWIKARMEEDLASLKANISKIPYQNQGVALLVDVANTRLRLATRQGIIAIDDDGNPEFVVSFIPVSEVPQSERANRVYNYVTWEARLSGAIRTGVVTGTLTV